MPPSSLPPEFAMYRREEIRFSPIESSSGGGLGKEMPPKKAFSVRLLSFSICAAASETEREREKEGEKGRGWRASILSFGFACFSFAY